MTTDLWMLALSCLLALLMPYTYIVPLMGLPGGMPWGLGNRDRPLEGEAPWATRARRAHANLVENLVVFAALVLVAHASGRSNAWTALGSQLFFWGRVGHAITYMAGLVPWRTVVFTVAVVGEWIIVLQLLVR
jgi:uncharacterized MAPEG superfamily protein